MIWNWRKAISLILTVVMVCNVSGLMIFADPSNVRNSGGSELDSSYTIVTAFDELDSNVEANVGTAVGDLGLPAQLGVTLGNDQNQTGHTTLDGFTWNCTTEGGYQVNTAGKYEFKAVLPSGYSLKNGVTLPTINVTLKDNGGGETVKTITGFTTVLKPVTAKVGTADTALELPTSLEATLTDGTSVTISDITWSIPNYDANTADTYDATAVMPADNGYKLADGLNMPTVEVTLTASEIVVSAFDALNAATATQSVQFGTPEESLNLPSTLNGTVNGAAGTITGITWTSFPEYKANVSDEYTFTPVIPASYKVTATTIPEIKVTVEAEPKSIIDGYEEPPVTIVNFGTSREKAIDALPKTVKGKLQGKTETVDVAVKGWTIPQFVDSQAGDFLATATDVTNPDPDKYDFTNVNPTMPTATLRVREQGQDAENIVSFVDLAPEVATQEIVAGSGDLPNLPLTLDAITDKGNTVKLSVEWTPNKTFDGTEGTYIYSAKVTTTDYNCNIETPKITVNVVAGGGDTTVVIKSFADLAANIAAQEIVAGSNAQPDLPPTLNATTDQGTTVTITVTGWTSTPEFKGDIVGEYEFKPTLPTTGYDFTGATAPTIKVNVVAGGGDTTEVIKSFAELAADVATQTIFVGSNVKPNLPGTLTATTEKGASVQINVTWTSKDFDGTKAGTYTYDATPTTPGYDYSKAATPKIIVVVKENAIPNPGIDEVNKLIAAIPTGHTIAKPGQLDSGLGCPDDAEYAAHKAAVEAAMKAYESLPTEDRAKIAAASVSFLKAQYDALLTSMNYKNKTDVVEIIGLTESVDLSGFGITAGDEVAITVESISLWPSQAVQQLIEKTLNSTKLKIKFSFDISLNVFVNGSLKGQAQPKAGEALLLKLKLPSNIRIETSRIIHINDQNVFNELGRSIITENGNNYALVNADSFSKFVLYAEEKTNGGGGSSSGGGGGGGGGSSTESFVITVKAGVGGSISPSSATVIKGKDATFTIKAKDGYEIKDVLVDNSSVGAVKEYTFENVTKKHTIEAIFEKTDKDDEDKDDDDQTTDNKDVFSQFTDVANHWAVESIRFVVERGLFYGVSDTAFGPDQQTTRGMIVTVLYRAEGSPAAGSHNFTDVTAADYYNDAVAWASSNGIVSGFGDGTYKPNDPITRQQMAVILYQYQKYKGADVSNTDGTKLAGLTDYSQIASWAQTAVSYCLNAGIMSGRTDGSFDPQGTATRAEIATVLRLMLQ